MSEQWEVKQHSWREIGIYSPTRQITMIDVENSFDVSEDNQDECEELALRRAHLISAAPELLEALARFVTWVDKQDLEYESSMVRQAKAAIAKAKGKYEQRTINPRPTAHSQRQPQPNRNNSYQPKEMQRKLKPLSNTEISKYFFNPIQNLGTAIAFARAIEAEHGITK